MTFVVHNILMRDITWAILPQAIRDRLHDIISNDTSRLLNTHLQKRRNTHQQRKQLHADCTESDVRSREIAELRSALINEASRWYGDLGIGAIRDGTIIRRIGGATVTIDIVEPMGRGPHPIIIYLHGGGWCADRARTYRTLSFRLAEAGYLVFNVDYRLAPEAPFPAGYEDCVYAVNWVERNASKYGGDPTRIALGGDSAGANLAAAVGVGMSCNHNQAKISALILLYGAYDLNTSIHSLVEAYLGDKYDVFINDPRVSPIVAAEHLPPCLVAVGSDDYAFDQSNNLVQALEQNSVDHEFLLLDKAPHGYMKFELLYPEQFAQTIDRIDSFLKKRFNC